MRYIICGILAVMMTGQIQLSQAAAEGRGEALVEKHCTSCHDDAIYTREGRRVTTVNGLQKQVRRCEQSLGLTWFDEEIADVVAYLNNNYYHFEQP
jgi:hypothetical protein